MNSLTVILRGALPVGALLASALLLVEVLGMAFESDGHARDLSGGLGFLRIWLVYAVAGATAVLAGGLLAKLRRSGADAATAVGAGLALLLGLQLAAVTGLRPGVVPGGMPTALAVTAVLVATVLRRPESARGDRAMMIALWLAVLAVAGVGRVLAHSLASQILSAEGMLVVGIRVAGAWALAGLAVSVLLRPRARPLLAVAAIHAALALVIIHRPGDLPDPVRYAEPPAGAPPVLLVVIDALRADMVDLSPGGLTPNLARLAGESIVYEHAVATAPWTTPSFGSFLTAAYPADHRAGTWNADRRYKRPLAEDRPTLAEHLNRPGYWTGAVITNSYLSPRFGLDRGFDAYRNALSIRYNHAFYAGLLGLGIAPELDGPYLDARRQNERILPMIDHAAARGRPWFVLAHYMDPHLPYEAPELVASAPANPSGMRDAYAAEVAYADHHLGRLLEELENRGLLDELLLIVTSDHGEELEEGRLSGGIGVRQHDHGHTLFDELLRVPLMIHLPGGERAGEVVAEPVSLIDLPVTILTAAGVDVPREFSGRSLLSRDTGLRTLYAEATLYGPPATAAMAGPLKAIVTDGRLQVFDRAGDPGEVQPLPPHASPSLAEAARSFSKRAVSNADSAAVEIDPALRRQLESLGYVK